VGVAFLLEDTMNKKEEIKNTLRIMSGKHKDDDVKAVCLAALVRIEKLEKLDREAANYVETPISMRTNFDGEGKYVGWKGLGIALEEALDQRDALLVTLGSDGEYSDYVFDLAASYTNIREVNRELHARVRLLENRIKILYNSTIENNDLENEDVLSKEDEG
jgi:hypothetical protein